MGINVSTSMGFENRDFLDNTAKRILKKSGMSLEKAESILKNSYFNRPEYDVYRSSAQVTINNSLNETLKYLKSHANDKRKRYILGELWEKLGEQQEEYQGELVNFEVDYNLTNIFAA